MSIENALYSWKQVAESTVQMKELQHRVTELQNLVRAAQVEFDDTLEGLSAGDRDAIFSIMTVYDNNTTDCEEDLQWLVNKVGNEGVDGISWNALLAAWQERYPERSKTELGLVLRRNQGHFARLNEAGKETYRLTPDGQASFLRD